ncbi:MAG: sugar transporter [Betaproteobacteria bacterium]|nr:sugar transporter [Betaproteobacteria bacterium]
MRRLATLVAVPLVAAAIAGCGIKGPLKPPDAAPAATPSATTPSSTVAPSTDGAGASTPKPR